MSISDTYHFHKDCKYYPECTEEIVKNGKQELVKFTCPKSNGHSSLYYKSDIHSIMWQCPGFEPYQPTLEDIIKGSEDKGE